MPADAPLSADRARGLCDLPAAVHARAAAAGQGGRGARAVVRIDALSRGSVIHRIFERFYDEWTGTGPAPLAPDAEQRMRAIAGEECDAAPGSRRDRLSGDVGGRPGRADRGLRALARASSARIELTRALPLVAVRGAVRPAAWPARSRARCRRRRADRDRAAVGRRCGCTGGSTGSTGTRSADALPRGRLQDRRGARDEKPAQLQGGRMLQLPLYVLAGAKLLGIDPAAGAAAYVYPTRKGEFHVVDWTPEDLAARHERRDRRCSTRSSTAARRGDFIIAPSDDGACDYCPFNADLPGRPRRLRRAQGRRRAARPARDRDPEHPVTRRAERPGGARADRRRARVKPRRRGRRRHRARRPCSSSGSPTCSRRGDGDRRSSWS